METSEDGDIRQLLAKEQSHRALIHSDAYETSRLAADAWTAAFVVPKQSDALAITTSTLRAALGGGSRVDVGTRQLIASLATQYSLFHAPIEFPLVFSRGGFSVVIGNPPWERVKLQEKEFFAEHSPAISNARNAAARKRMIAALENDDPALWRAFQAALRQADGESHLLRDTCRYPLTGRGDINTYSVFAEGMRSMIGPVGRAGVIVPTGIATDDTTKHFFGDLVSNGNLASLHAFENEEFIFQDVHHATKFCLLTLTGRERRVGAADFVFFARQTSWLADPERHFTLTANDFELLNPNTRTSPTFRSRRDAEIAKAVYRRLPVLVRDDAPEGNPWDIAFVSMLHMANDSSLFLDTQPPQAVPLYEGKMIHQFDHRHGTYEGQTRAQANVGVLPQPSDEQKSDPTYATRPQYWVELSEVKERLRNRWDREWLICWRDITSSVAIRTMIAAAIPRVATNNKLPIALSEDANLPLLLANLNSFAFDWQARQKLGGTGFTFYVLKQLPVLAPLAYSDAPPWLGVSLGSWLRKYIVELTYTSWEMEQFAVDLGWRGGPFLWSRARRSTLRAEVDSAFFHLYGLARDDVEHVLESFWIVRHNDERDHGDYRTKGLILSAYDAMARASTSRPFVSSLTREPGDPAVAHPPRERGTAGHWIPWEDVLRQRPSDHAPRPRRRERQGPGSTVAKSPSRDGARRRAVMRASAPPVRRPNEPQSSLSDLLRGNASGSPWKPESVVDPSSLVLGIDVRHRAFGEGTILSVRETAGSTSLLIRFTNAQREIAFGFGLLEFRI